MIEHDENREKEVQMIVAYILDNSPTFWDLDYSATFWSCPYCGKYVYGGCDEKVTMNDIRHALDCVYLIAKSLKI